MAVPGNAKTYMSNEIFVDTNILVYAYDRSEPGKQKRALFVLNYLAQHRLGVISAQVMAEFAVAVMRKISSPLSAADTYQRLENYQQSWRIVDLTPAIVLEAVRGVREYQFSHWDAQIWAAARLNQISYVFSEDFRAGAVVEGVRFINPLAEDFSLADWT